MIASGSVAALAAAAGDLAALIPGIPPGGRKIVGLAAIAVLAFINVRETRPSTMVLGVPRRSRALPCSS